MSNSSTLYLSPRDKKSSFAPTEDNGLERHVRECADANGALHGLRCKAEAADSFLSGRVISIIVVAGTLLALVAYW